MPESYRHLGECVEDYLRYQRNHQASKNTQRTDTTLLRRLVRDLGDIQVRNVTKAHLNDWFYGPTGLMSEHSTNMLGRKTNPAISASAHNTYLNRLRTFFKWCVSNGYARSNPAAEISRIKRIPTKARLQPPPDMLLQMLDAAANPRDRAYIATALNTAMRSSEISIIQIKDVDLDNNYLSVHISKTGEIDEQPVSSDLELELRNWLSTYQKALCRPLEDDDYLFPSRKGNLIAGYATDDQGNRVMLRTPMSWLPKTPITKTETVIQHALEKLGYKTYQEGTHTIRRAIARAFFDAQCASEGYDMALRITSALLHHSSTATTEIYLGLTAEKARRDKILRGKPFLTAIVNKENVVQLRAVK